MHPTLKILPTLNTLDLNTVLFVIRASVAYGTGMITEGILMIIVSKQISVRL